MYSERMRRMRPSGLFTKDSFSYAREAGCEFTFTHDEVVFPFNADLLRGSEPLPRIRSRYPAIPGRCIDRAQSRWKRRSAILEIQAESDCLSTPASRAGSAEELPWRRKQIPAAEPEDDAAKAEPWSAEGGRHRFGFANPLCEALPAATSPPENRSEFCPWENLGLTSRHAPLGRAGKGLDSFRARPQA